MAVKICSRNGKRAAQIHLAGNTLSISATSMVGHRTVLGLNYSPSVSRLLKSPMKDGT